MMVRLPVSVCRYCNAPWKEDHNCLNYEYWLEVGQMTCDRCKDGPEIDIKDDTLTLLEAKRVELGYDCLCRTIEYLLDRWVEKNGDVPRKEPKGKKVRKGKGTSRKARKSRK